MRPVAITALLLLSVFVTGCGPTVRKEKEVKLGPPKERQLPPDGVYSRLTWSQLAHPLPEPASYSGRQAPAIKPIMTVDLKQVEFREAIQTVARTIGYRWAYPESVATRRVTVKVTGTIEEIATALGKEAGVSVELDRQKRIMRALEIAPKLPGLK